MDAVEQGKMKQADGALAYAVVDEDGGLRLPSEVVKAFGLKPGARAYFEKGEDTLLLHRPVSSLARIYLEPTTRCNMNCRMCVRHSWLDGQGDMEPGVFRRLLDSIGDCSPRPTVIFGGFGEPLVHPEIIPMIGACKNLGCRVELITNGLLLDEPCVNSLLESDLDQVWVSLDGGAVDCGELAGHGGSLETVKRNLRSLAAAKFWSTTRKPHLGVAFVATRNNISELPEVYRLATNYLADRFLVSNLLPYTEEMTSQVMYSRSRWNWPSFLHQLILPRIDVEDEFFESLKKIGGNDEWTYFLKQEFRKPFDTCPFIERGSLAVRWDGQVSPCLPLLHDYDSYLGKIRRRTHSFSPGSLQAESLLSIWNKPEYVKLRTRVREFDFSPCSICSSCEFAESNEEDCFGNLLPTCGGCLWAQGFIQCP